ncbi:MAG: site-2 protease family protein [Candidatus Portnoybacteria bacterium CG10_big_fil_rev_8_21_14_0_10_38_18]|uniref:Site-2 protease family protein n=1 Tax=Candidatus Portnoybacteria bacterium CG10_big_fil_rev_8_21_14_0_10_38_18 TaxID=1974813 RepID=A0A2M8KCH4_9BACT|nr:MAG: site-2 protease family protein [Candidatus Portnoybacteria bacterium CG10_big_fil_rev_8_21_14_0_10_38_18]
MDPIILIIQLAILLMSVVIHEVSHGLMANHLGDPTAKYAGRLTLNPIKHLDLWGSFIIPLSLLIIGSPILFGYAKPVPYNPYNLKNKKWGPAIVATAGPGSNLIIALIFGLSLRFMAFGNSVYMQNLVQIFAYIVLLNLLLAVFNLVPIPPLDGSKILFALLPYKYQQLSFQMERYGLILVLFFIFFLFRYITPVIFWLFKIIVGSSLL